MGCFSNHHLGQPHLKLVLSTNFQTFPLTLMEKVWKEKGKKSFHKVILSISTQQKQRLYCVHLFFLYENNTVAIILGALKQICVA